MKIGKGERLVLYCANGCLREQLGDAAERALGSAWRPSPAPDEETGAKIRAGKQAASLRRWVRSTTALGSLADRYLAGRALPGLAGSAALRFLADCQHPEGGKLPAMIALVLDATGQPQAVHRTFLSGNGLGKAKVDPARAGLGPCWGSAVRLDPFDAERPLVVSEGIETSASAGRLLSLPAWAAVSAGNLARGLILPEQVREIVIAADADGPGRRAADDAARRWRAEGRHVRIKAPDLPGLDFNDLLIARAAEVPRA